MQLSRVAAVGALTAAALVAVSGPAFAHVTVQPDGAAAKGGYATINFKVPNERDNASTVKVEVTFPTDHPLASAMPQPVPGWDIEVTKSKLDKPLEVHGRTINEAVSKITWTADGKGVEPGFFQKFPVSVGSLPEDADELVFKAIQTYSNKEVVRWIEVPEKGSEEPEYPAPVLTLTAAEGGSHGASADQASDKKDSAADSDDKHGEKQAAGSGGSDTTARVLGGVGIAVGAAGVAFGVLAGRRRSTGAGA